MDDDEDLVFEDARDSFAALSTDNVRASSEDGSLSEEEGKPDAAKHNPASSATADTDSPIGDEHASPLDGSPESTQPPQNWDNLLDPKEAEAQLSQDLAQLKTAVDLFLNSQYKEAETMLRSKFRASFYYTHGLGTLMALKAIMTFEAADIKAALEVLQTTIDMAYFYRKRDFLSNLTGFMRGQSLQSMTRMERHAELTYAEAYLLRALLVIISDESLLSFVKEGLNIRSAYMIYKQCFKWCVKAAAATAGTVTASGGEGAAPQKATPAKKSHGKSSTAAPPVKFSDDPGDYDDGRPIPPLPGPDTIDADFVSGVCFGIGLFNVLLSMLPKRVISIFEVIGFSGSRNFGLRMLQHPRIHTGLRRFLCDITLMAYHSILPLHVPFLDYDLPLAEALVRDALHAHPKGALYLYLAGRVSMVKGDCAETIQFMHKSIDSQKEWEQLHHICYWDMALCYSQQLQFLEAAKCTQILAERSRWSKATYHYLTAVNTYTAKQLAEPGADTSNISVTLESIPGRMQRIAGRRIPLEKFVARKSRKYKMQGDRLFLPALEMLLIRNGYAAMPVSSLERVLQVLDTSITEMCKVEEEFSGAKNKRAGEELPLHFHDDLCLAYLIRGVVQRELKMYVESMDTFHSLLSIEHQLVLDHYLAPMARYELAKLYLTMTPPMVQEARQELDSIKREYKKYSLENNVHFRVHNAMRRIYELEGKSRVDSVHE